MSAAGRLRWGRILVGGFLAEAALIALAIPISVKFGQGPLLYIAPAGSFILCFLSAIWVGRKLESRFVLHGFLVGLVATVIYLVLTKFGPEPIAYIVAHGLKLAGGVLGGLVAAQRSAGAAAPS